MFMHPAGGKSFEIWQGVKNFFPEGHSNTKQAAKHNIFFFFFNNKLKMRMVKQQIWRRGQQKRNGYLEFSHHQPYFVYSV